MSTRTFSVAPRSRCAATVALAFVTAFSGVSVANAQSAADVPASCERGDLSLLLIRGEYRSILDGCKHADLSYRPWLTLYRAQAEAGVDDTKTALKLLSEIPKASAASLYGDALRLELDRSLGIKEVSSRAQIIRERCKEHRISFIEPQLQVAELRAKAGSTSPREIVRELQAIRARYRNNFASDRARRLQEEVVRDKNVEIVKDQALIAGEVRALSAERSGEDALKLLKMASLSTLLDSWSADEWESAIAAINGVSDSEKFLASVASRAEKLSSEKRVPFYRAAGIYSWKKSRYADAQQYAGKLPSNHLAKSLIEGRVADSKGETATARRLLSRYVEKVGVNEDPSLAIRVLLLHLYEKDKNGAVKIAKLLERSKSARSSVGDDVASYWIGKATGKPSGITATIPLSFYSFADSPAALERLAPPTIPDRKLQSCKVPGVELSPSLERDITALYSKDRVTEAIAEARFALPPAKDLSSAVARARAVHSVLPANFAWADLISGISYEKLFSSECGREAFDLLYPDPFPKPYVDAASNTGVPRTLLLALSRTESAFNPKAVSPVGALGLMQLMPKTADRLKKGSGTFSSLTDPLVNVELGSRYLAQLNEELGGKWHLTIASYNAGPEAVKKWLVRYPNASPSLFVDLIPYPETKGYVKKVLEANALYSGWDKLSTDSK